MKKFFSAHNIPLITLCLYLIFPTAAFSFSLVAPQKLNTYFSGEYIPVKLDIGEVAGLTAVHYFWYAEDEDMLEELVEQKLALISTSQNNPPFGGTIRAPRSAIGTYRLLAVGQLEAGQIDTEKWAVFDEVLIKIEPKAQLNEIDFENEKPLRFGSAASARVYDQVDFLGKTFALPIIGRFSDGTIRSLRTKDTGTTYVIADERVATINEHGLLRLTGNGSTTLTVKNRDQEARLDIQVRVQTQSNQPPVSQPGESQTVYSSDPVTLNGLASYDSDGGSLQYRWSQVRGSKISLLDPYSGTAKFLAPFVHEKRLFRFKLQVTDTLGADSNPAYVDVIVTP
jgi:K319L-like, PKD domain